MVFELFHKAEKKTVETAERERERLVVLQITNLKVA